MSKWSLPVVALLLVATSPALAEERETVRTIRQTFAATGIERLELDLPVGEARILGEERGDIQVVFELRCEPERKRCADVARGVTLVSSTHGGRLTLDLRGFDDGPRKNLVLRGVVRVPAGADTRVEMGVGELEIEGLVGDVEAELGVGEMNLRLPFDAVRAVSLEAGIGETNLHLPTGQHTEERSHFVGGETDWRQGDGSSAIDAEVGVGEVNAHLE